MWKIKPAGVIGIAFPILLFVLACDLSALSQTASTNPTATQSSSAGLASPTGESNLPTSAPTPAPNATLVANASPTPRLLAGATVSPAANAPTAAPLAVPRLVGYFFGTDKNNHVSDISTDKLTHVIYAFVNVSDAGDCVSMDSATDTANFPALRQLKQQHPKLQTLISVGGYSHSAKFSDAAVSADSRRRFAQSCVQFMKQNGFEGIDIDWELPVSGGMAGNVHRPEDKQNYTAMLAELRRQLDVLGASDGHHYLLTIAAPIAPSEIKNIEVTAIAQYLDWFNLESYAFYTASSPTTNFNAPLYASTTDPAPDSKRLSLNADAAAHAYLAAGVPASKLLIGVPFYGRGWKGVADANHGLYQNDTGAAADSKAPKGTWSDGAILYGALEKNYLNSYSRYWQDEAKEPWLYNPSTGIMITYEDPQSLSAKADYVAANHLGGIMIWHVSADDTQHSLLNAIYSRWYP